MLPRLRLKRAMVLLELGNQSHANGLLRRHRRVGRQAQGQWPGRDPGKPLRGPDQIAHRQRRGGRPCHVATFAPSRVS
jgi:hypothetical protein